jgi:uncharacterized protein (TIGR03435 family)
MKNYLHRLNRQCRAGARNRTNQDSGLFCKLINLAVLAVVFSTALGVVVPRQLQAQPNRPALAETLPNFEVALIRPSKPDHKGRVWNGSINRISIANYTLREIIKVVYGLKSESQVLGGPKWLDTKSFDIVAKIDDAEVANLSVMTDEDKDKRYALMLQSLLADRFQLKVSRAERTLPVYALTVSKSGSKLTPTPPAKKSGTLDEIDPSHTGHNLIVKNGRMTANAISMDSLAEDLTGLRESGNRVVVNATHLTGDYDFVMDWTQDRGDGVPGDAQYPGLFTALQEQLGLKIEAKKQLVEVIVVEAATMPVFD